MKRRKADPTNPTEYDEQVFLIEWARMMADTGREPRLALLHGDFGNQITVAGGRRRKATGRVSGWPDLFLPVGKSFWEVGIGDIRYNGLFCELKRRKGGTVRQEQKAIHELLRREGYHVVVCRGADAAIKAIKLYLGIA